MILARIEQYMRDHRRSALTDMAISLDAAPDALRSMLGILERKGRVRRLPSFVLTRITPLAPREP